MGRWDQYGERIDFNPGHSWYSYAKENSCAKAIIDAHNADCDAYEQRIAELAAELERVKVESLRVVPDGGACAAGDARGNHTFIMRGGDVFMSEPHLWDWVRIDGTYAELNDDIFVQPVRLERWEGHP